MSRKIDFDPIKEDKDGVKAKRMIWSTKTLDLAIKGLGEGRKLVANPFYENNIKLLKGDLVFQRTPEEVAEWKKCKKDIHYFVEKYCKLMTPEGIKHITLRDYQHKYLDHLDKNQLSVYLACRQCGKTTTTCIYLLHYLLFNVDKNTLICANILKTAKEIIDKTKKIFVELPFFLKPGIYKWNESEIVLDNGCRVQCTSTTGTSGIGFTINMLVLDEFAHLAPNIAERFYNNIFPTVVASKAKVAITSTQNGRNLFYRIYKAAEAGESDYKPFKTDWYEVPEWNPDKKCWEKRDEEWRRLQIANYGSEEAFNSQFGTNFDISSNTLISQKILSKLSTSLVEFINKEIPGVIAGDSFYWHPNFDPHTLKQNHIIITGDLSEGVERDYTVFMISRMIEPESGKLECIGFFRSNSLSRETCALAIQTLICKYCDLDKVLLSYERNTYGDLFYKQLIENAEKDPLVSDFDEGIIVKYFNENGTKFNRGIKITSGNKTVHCKLFKEDFEKGLITNDSLQTSIELGNFNDDGTGHYKAVFGHDDLVMTMVQLTFVKNTLQYKMMKSDFDSQIEPQQSQQDSNYDIYAESWGEDIYDLDVKGNVGRLNRFINQL